MRCIIAYFLLITFSVRAQQDTYSTNTLFAEGLGAAGAYSLNYDKILFTYGKTRYSVRAGIALLFPDTTSGWITAPEHTPHRTVDYLFPLMLNRITGRYNHHFETGIGMTLNNGYKGDVFTQKIKRQTVVILTGFIGYRYQKPEGGLMIRAGWNPFYDIKQDWFIPYWVGAGIGYTFKSQPKNFEQSDKKTDLIYTENSRDIYVDASTKKSLTDSVWTDSTHWKKSNTLFVEAGGYSLISPSYDKIIYVKRSLKLSIRAGLSFFPGNQHNGKATLASFVPVGVNCFWGRWKHHFQTGLGELYINMYDYPNGTISTSSETENIDIFVTLLYFGYRYQKPKGGLFFQAGWTPALFQIENGNFSGINPFNAGVGIGYSFLSKGFRKQKKQ